MNQISTLSKIFSEDWKREWVQQDTNWKGIFTLTAAFFSLAKEISDLSPFFEVIYFDIEQRETLTLFEFMKIQTLLKIKTWNQSQFSQFYLLSL